MLVCVISACTTIQPDWISHPPEHTEDTLFFVGVSKEFSSEQDARNDAERDAALKIAKHGGEFISSSYEENTSYMRKGRNIQSDTEEIHSALESYAAMWISQIRPVNYHTAKKQKNYTVYVLVEISRKAVENYIRNFVDDSTWLYAAVVFKGNPLTAAEQQSLWDALQEGLQSVRVPLHLVSQTDIAHQASYFFEITLSSQAQASRIDNRIYTRYTVTIGFMRDGVRLHFGSDNFVELSTVVAFNKAAQLIKGNKAFYQGLHLRLVSQ
ncbi:hypothetical protein ACYULU_04335 [Breznakiellaceae bacterium SP9]